MRKKNKKSSIDWSILKPAFSNLRFDPCDSDAWELWHYLTTTHAAQNDSGKELLSFLIASNENMSNAFTTFWPIIDALEENYERYDQAAAQWKAATNIKEFPTDMLYLDLS